MQGRDEIRRLYFRNEDVLLILYFSGNEPAVPQTS